MDITKYLPPVAADYEELKELCSTEQEEFKMVQQCVLNISNNALISTASEDHIEKYEKMLGIYAGQSYSLSQRRQRLKQYLLSPDTYTLLSVVNEITAASISKSVKYTILFSDYLFELQCTLPPYLWEIYQDKLRNIVPANIMLELKNNAIIISGELCVGTIKRTTILRRIGF